MSVIALAGCDGVGKTTYANSGVFSGLTVYREPGGSPLGEFLRSEILVNSGGFPYSDRSRKLMFLTARSALWDKIDFLSAKTSCVLDRSVVCFLVYDMSFLGEVSEAAALERNLVLLDLLQIPFPDEVILLDSDPMLIARRLLAREPEILQDDLFWESWLGRSKCIDFSSDKKSIDFSSDKKSIDFSSDKKSIDFSSIGLNADKKSIEPHTDKGSIEPHTDKGSIEPHTDKGSIESRTDWDSIRGVDNLAHILWFMQERYKVVCRVLLERGLINRFVIKEYTDL